MAVPFELASAPLAAPSGGVNRKTALKMSQAGEKSTVCCFAVAKARNFRKTATLDAPKSAARMTRRHAVM
jgi:hypothetical protein